MTAPDGSGRLVDLVSRDLFIPNRIWIDDGEGGFRALIRDEEPERWRQEVAVDGPVVTQLNNGEHGKPDQMPSSSCSQPSIVEDMLNALAPQLGDAVLEIGTGTGWNAALLASIVGDDGRVASIEVDADLADQARAALRATGFAVTVLTADGTNGFPGLAPFDRVISTAAIRDAVPSAWLDQLRPGGRLVTPWGNDWDNGTMLVLDKHVDGSATGSFRDDLAFMRLRSQQISHTDWDPGDAVIGASPWREFEGDDDELAALVDPNQARFPIGVLVPDVYMKTTAHKFGEMHHGLWLDDFHTGSWAEVAVDLNTAATTFRYRHGGPRDLWGEVHEAYRMWRDSGEPGVGKFALSIQVNGEQWLWTTDQRLSANLLSPLIRRVT